MLLILLHGQSQVYRGFGFNSKVLKEKKESLVAQRNVTDHMHYNNIQAQELRMTKKLLGNVKEASSRYFTTLKEKSQSKLPADKQTKLKALNDYINEINQQASVLKRAIVELRADSDKAVLSAEKKQPTKMLSLLL